jgi:hypothetical protein
MVNLSVEDVRGASGRAMLAVMPVLLNLPLDSESGRLIHDDNAKASSGLTILSLRIAQCTFAACELTRRETTKGRPFGPPFLFRMTIFTAARDT